MSVSYTDNRITGNTYEQREALKLNGCIYNKDNKYWDVPESVDKKLY